MNWDVRGYFDDENFTVPGGTFFTAIQGLTTQTAVDWLHKVAPIVCKEAQRICPQDKSTGKMRDSIYARYNDAEMYAEIGSNLPAAGGRTYILFQELGYEQNGIYHPGRHFLSGALANVMERM